jgi:hypothetical protein
MNTKITSPKDRKIASPAVAKAHSNGLLASALQLLTEHRTAIGTVATAAAIVCLLLTLGVSTLGLATCASVTLACILI